MSVIYVILGLHASKSKPCSQVLSYPGHQITTGLKGSGFSTESTMRNPFKKKISKYLCSKYPSPQVLSFPDPQVYRLHASRSLGTHERSREKLNQSKKRAPGEINQEAETKKYSDTQTANQTTFEWPIQKAI